MTNSTNRTVKLLGPFEDGIYWARDVSCVFLHRIEPSIFVSVWKWSFTFVSTVSRFLTISYSFLNFCLYLVLLEGSAIINIFFTVLKLFSFRKFLMQTAITSAFPIFFTVVSLCHCLTDSIKTLFTLICNLSFYRLFKYVFLTINFKFIHF